MKILFIGNSHTFCNGLPYQVRELLHLGNPDVYVTMCATGGMTLGWHAEQPETQMAIKFDDWDYIVLQQKTHPFDGYDNLLKEAYTPLNGGGDEISYPARRVGPFLILNLPL